MYVNYIGQGIIVIKLILVDFDGNNAYKLQHYNPLTEMNGSAVKRGNSIKGIILTIIDRPKNLTERVKLIYGKNHNFVGQ